MDLSDEKSCAQKVTPPLLFSDEWVEMVDGNFRPKIRPLSFWVSAQKSEMPSGGKKRRREKGESLISV